VAPFHFVNELFYGFNQHLPGDVVDFDAADTDNLTKGGSGHTASDCPGDGCPCPHAVPQPAIEPVPVEPKPQPSRELGTAQSLTCPRCQKPFTTAAATAAS
jgi:hypothetical protein